MYGQFVQLTPLLVKSVRRWKGQRGYFWLVSIDICNYTRRLMPLTSMRCVNPNTSKCECPQRWQLHLLVIMLACMQKSHNSLSLQKRSQVLTLHKVQSLGPKYLASDASTLLLLLIFSTGNSDLRMTVWMSNAEGRQVWWLSGIDSVSFAAHPQMQCEVFAKVGPSSYCLTNQS